MVMDGHWSYCGYFIMNKNVESCTAETNMIFNANYNSIKSV